MIVFYFSLSHWYSSYILELFLHQENVQKTVQACPSFLKFSNGEHASAPPPPLLPKFARPLPICIPIPHLRHWMWHNLVILMSLRNQHVLTHMIIIRKGNTFDRISLVRVFAFGNVSWHVRTIIDDDHPDLNMLTHIHHWLRSYFESRGGGLTSVLSKVGGGGAKNTFLSVLISFNKFYYM